MLDEYNNDKNMYGFLMDEESKKKFIEAQIDGERYRGELIGEKRGIEKTRLKTAKSLLKDNVPFNIIKNATGYSEEYLKTIKV